MKITNNSAAPQGIHAVSGLVWLKPKETKDMELDEAQAKRVAELEFLSVEGKPGKASPAARSDGAALKAKDAEIAELTKRVQELEAEVKAKDEQIAKLGDDGKSGDATKFEAKHRGGGSYSVLDAEGNEVVEKLDKDGAEKFNALSDEDKAKFVDANKKAD